MSSTANTNGDTRAMPPHTVLVSPVVLRLRWWRSRQWSEHKSGDSAILHTCSDITVA